MTRTRTGAGTSQGGNDDDLPPPPPPFTNEFFHTILGKPANNGRNTTSHCAEHSPCPPAELEVRVKSI